MVQSNYNSMYRVDPMDRHFSSALSTVFFLSSCISSCNGTSTNSADASIYLESGILDKNAEQLKAIDYGNLGTSCSDVNENGKNSDSSYVVNFLTDKCSTQLCVEEKVEYRTASNFCTRPCSNHEDCRFISTCSTALICANRKINDNVGYKCCRLCTCAQYQGSGSGSCEESTPSECPNQ